MKILIVLLSLFTTGSFSMISESENANEKQIVVSIQYTDGTSIEKTYALSEFDKIVEKKLTSKEVFSCTYGFSNGECEITASTCEAAKAGFCACASELGHNVPSCTA